ncbi:MULTISPECIES: DUF3800 domain-containing protein [Providencia]|uniref:DUF3800 domain-containing protein n=1 Tax=Providencia TaxID=586 RepID=UPI00234A9034|nr:MULTISPECIES: DUF3800 domain-containing protein [Providencia]MCL0015463.1 DUF3800 domain-containing protein [Providencia rettgeri]MDE4732137.1 DUF3800 domain-containing protein [Providencia rettgeri]MDH2366351.1 DUF3800 domain-containing protein [Providencia rettgeri]
MDYFLDESGNTGDLVKMPSDLNFANQPFFSLACVGVPDCENLNSYINELKKKHKIQGEELKSTNIYKSNPKFMLELFKYIEIEKLPFYIEVVDKKYTIIASMIESQITPPYFNVFEMERQKQVFKIELSDYLSENLPNRCYDAFFESCLNKSDENLLKSMKCFRNYFSSNTFDFKYKNEALKSLKNTIRFFHNEKKTDKDILNKLTPIPDINKRGAEIHILPHVNSWFNIIGKVNKYHKKDLSDVKFFHDKQDHFDDILLYCIDVIKKNNAINPFDPSTDYNVTGDILLEFPDSKKSSGIQLADILAGFTSRYASDFLYNKHIDDIYHDVFMQLKKCYSKDDFFSVNFVLPLNRRNILFEKFSL